MMLAGRIERRFMKGHFDLVMKAIQMCQNQPQTLASDNRTCTKRYRRWALGVNRRFRNSDERSMVQGTPCVLVSFTIRRSELHTVLRSTE
jgi:hypothetical protein